MNFDQQLKKLSGEPLKISERPGEEFTLKLACTEALCVQYPKEDIDGREKMARYRLAKRIEDAEKGGDVELKAEDITKLKELTGRHFTPLIVGQVWEMLDPAESK